MKTKTVKDINGKPIAVGDRCVYVGRVRDRKRYVGRVVTVRKIDSSDMEYAVCVDDGDPGNPDIMTNGFRWVAWISGKELAGLTAALTVQAMEVQT